MIDEVMSEPRNGDNAAVHRLHVDACRAIWEADPRAACIVGAANYYDRDALNATILLPHDKPVLYAANLFEPREFITNPNGSYPATSNCCMGTLGCYYPTKNITRCRASCGCDGVWQTVRAAPLHSLLQIY